jgi:hypothetical protein
MSQATDTATAAPLPRDPARSGKQALRWFETMIWHDHEVCSECFSRLKRSDIAERDGWGHEDEMSWRTDTACLGEDLVEPPATVANCAPKPEAKTTCLECGSVRGLSQNETLSSSEAIDRVPALAARLQEAGYHVRTDVVYHVVEHLKGQEAHTADDKRIFAVAAALGVQR